ncbi:MAG: hypothetical protein DRJ45_08085, partial [Thermoprotei archaeon]
MEDPSGVLTEEEEWWLSDRERGETAPALIARFRCEKLKFKLYASEGNHSIIFYGSTDMKNWTDIMGKILSFAVEGEDYAEVDFKGYAFIRIVLRDDPRPNRFLRLSK